MIVIQVTMQYLYDILVSDKRVLHSYNDIPYMLPWFMMYMVSQ